MRPLCIVELYVTGCPKTLIYYIVLYLHTIEKEGCVSFGIIVSTVVLRVNSIHIGCVAVVTKHCVPPSTVGLCTTELHNVVFSNMK